MIVNNLYYELELEGDIQHPEDDEFDLFIVLNIMKDGKTNTYRIPVSDMDKIESLKPLIEDLYRSQSDEVFEYARTHYEREHLIDALEYK